MGLVGLVLVGALVAAACGSKVDPESLAATGGAGLTPYAEDGVGPTGVADAPTDDVASGAATPGQTAAARPGSNGGQAADGGGGTTDPSAATESAATADDGFAPGVTADTVRIGMHLPMSISGLDVSSLFPLKEAVNAYWDSRNREGGIHGRKVEVILGDDQYTPSGAVQACKTLVEQHDVFFVYGAAGADQISACGQYTLSQGRPYLSSGSVEQGLLGDPNYWSFNMTYEPLSALMAEYAVAELDGANRPMAMLRMNTPNAESSRRGFVTRARELGAEIVVDDAVDKDPNPSQLQATCIKMQQEGVEIAFMMSSGLVMAQAADSCASQGYYPQWLGVSISTCGVEPPLGSESLDGCIYFSGAHHPGDTDSPLENQARQDWEAIYPGDPFPGDADPLVFLVWAISDALREALERTGPTLTVATFNQTMGGLVYDNQLLNPLDFRDGSHVGGHGVVVWRADAGAGRLVEIDSRWRLGFGG